MTWHPHITVAAVTERDGEFLLVEECVDGSLVLNQPAGHLEDGENLLDAVIRETREESAWHFLPEAIVGIYRWRHPSNHETFIRATFCGSVSEHDPQQVLDDGIVRSVWLKYAALTNQPQNLRSPLVLRSIDDYLAGKRYSLSILSDLL